MRKMPIAEEFFSLIQRGWNVVGRNDDKLAYVTNENLSKGQTIQKLFENGFRQLLDRRGNVILSRDLDGTVSKFDYNLCRDFKWTKKLDTGKYGWYNKPMNIWK